jgi:2-oxoglutarate ferredoxin oxidoreductase subunit beta
VTAIEVPSPTLRSGLFGVPALDQEQPRQTRKDFTSDAEVRWCPGCGDYAILSAVQSFLPELGLRRENIVCVSGIGCSSRFPYYLDTFGMHSIHGRAPAIATGLAVARPDLSVWVVTGDGDALSIGGNHLIHALRRNINITIMLFNNRIYGLTKGQYSPTSEIGKVTKSTPLGSVDMPFNPVSLAIGAEASFVARTLDSDRKHLTSVLRAAAAHRGASLVEIYQNCPIFNDGAFDLLKDRDEATARLIRLEHGEPIRFGPLGADGLGNRALVRNSRGQIEAVDAHAVDAEAVLVHDAHDADPSVQFALARLDGPEMIHVPMGVFRDVDRPVYDDLVRSQVRAAIDDAGGPATDDDVARMLAGKDTWTVN